MMKTVSKVVLILIMLFSTTNLTFLAPIVEAEGTNPSTRLLGKLATFGDRNDDYFTSVVSVNDGHVAVGYSDSTEGDLVGLNKGFHDAIIVKYDHHGNVKWKKTFGGSMNEKFNSVIATDNGFVAVGITNSEDEDLTGLNKEYENALIVKYDNSGNVEWKNTLGGNSSYSFISVTATSDGYIAVGNLNDNAGIVKYDINGNEIWRKTFGGSQIDIYQSITATSDGFVAVGETSSTDGDVTGLNKGHQNGIIVKYDIEGNIKWKKTFGGSLWEAFNSIITTDDGYLAAGYASSKNGDLKGSNIDSKDAIIVKYDRDGNIEWKKTFGGSQTDLFNSVSEIDGGYIAVGSAFSNDQDLANLNNGGQEAMMVRFDHLGNVIWKKTIGGDHYNEFTSVAENEYGIVAVGYSDAYDSDAIILDLRAANQIEKLTIDYNTEFRIITINPEDPDENFEWTSSNVSVIPQDFGGFVRVRSYGLVYLEGITSKNSNDRITIPIEVNEYVTITLPTEPIYLTTGEISKLTAEITPVDAANQNITWTSNKPSVATVDQMGNVTAVSKGKAVITATSEVGIYKATSKIVVSRPYYNVTFDSQGGTPVTEVLLEGGELVPRPKDAPTKAGYTFGGWYKDMSLTKMWSFTEDRVESDTKIYAKWIKSYTMNFNSNGGNITNPITANENTTITAPPVPKRTGYTFAGWYKEATGKTPWDFSKDKVTANTTLYAKWTINRYTVIFNSNSGNVVNPKTANYETTIAAPPVPKKTGYTFAGWYKEASGKTPWNFSKDKVTANTTLYAKWTINRYTVRFNSNGGSAVNPKNTTYNTTLTAPSVPIKKGHTFVGWYKDSNFKTPWNFSKDKVTANTTLYAKWTVTPPSAPTSISVNKLSSTKIKVAWSRVSDVSGYEVYRATKKNGTYHFIKSTTALSYTNIGLKKDTAYYYKVRSYKLIGTKKVYSGWTVVKSART